LPAASREAPFSGIKLYEKLWADGKKSDVDPIGSMNLPV